MPSLLARLSAASSSLQFRVVLGTVAALVVGIATVSLTAEQQIERDTLRMQRQRELGEAVHAADLLSHRVVDLQRALHATAGPIDRRTSADVDALERLLVAQPVLRVMFSDVDVLSAEGRMRLYVGPEGVRRPELDLHDREYFQRTVHERRSVVSEPVMSRLLHEPVLLLTEPLQDAEGLHGVLTGTLQLSRSGLLDDLTEPANAPPGTTVIVTDATGRILAAPGRDNVLRPIAGDPRFERAFTWWKASGSAAEPSGITYERPGALVSIAGVAGPEWVVWRYQTESALLAPLEDARRRALVLAAGLIAGLSLAAWLWLRQMLRPLHQVQDRARTLFDGSCLPHEGWPEVGGEIGRLSSALQEAAHEHDRLERANRLTMKKLASVMSSAPVGIAFTRGHRFELVSAEFCRLFGRPEAVLLGMHPRLLHENDEDAANLNTDCEVAFAAGEPYAGEWRLRHADGTLFWAQVRSRVVDPQNRGAGTIWTVIDIGEQIARRERLEWTATHDPLTGLGNRHAFEEALVRVFAARPRSIPAALVIIDLDHFKPVNDAAGHTAGDAVLKAVALAIAGSVRNSDLVARIGGDEFALVLERCPADVAQRVAENVRDAVHAVSVGWGGRVLRVGASVGVAPLTLEMEDAAAWVEAADSACYDAKASGRGLVRSAAPAAVDDTPDPVRE